MAKHTSKEAYFERLKNLADVNRPAIKESKIRNLGSLIDYKRAADGVAYGIVKENHNYFLKKAGTKQDPNVADFAYIGGMENITGFQYKSLAEADKQRNMIFHTINEATSLKPDKNGSKKKRLHEGGASDEIDQAASKLGDLDAATSAEEVPAGPPAEAGLEGGDEMAAGLDAKPAGEEAPAPDLGGDEVPAEPVAPEGGDEMPTPDLGGGEEAPASDLGGGEEPEGDEPEGGEAEPEGDPDVAANTDGSIDEPNRELEKAIGKITNKIRKTEMEDSQVKSYINSYLVAFKDKLRDIDIEDRKEMANKILKVVGQEEIADLGDSIPQEKPEDTDLGPESGLKPEGGIEEEQCAECGGFGKYAESRGYASPEAFMECDDEEKANVISGYANAHGEGQNDGDFKTIAILITPEILEKLKGDYGHEDFAGEVEPLANEMNESSDEDKMIQLKEFWGGLGSLAKGAVGGIQKGAQAVGNAVGGAVDAAKTGVGNAVAGVKQQYYKGEIDPAQKKLDTILANTASQINALNDTKTKAGQPADVTLKTVTAKLKALLKPAQGAVAETANGIDPSNTQVGVTGMIKEADKVCPGNKVVSEPNMLKEDDEIEEPEEKEFDVDAIETPEGGEEVETGEVDVEPEVDDTKDGIGFAPAAQSLAAGVVKAGGAPTTGVDITIQPDKTVNINMNESEVKLRKYVRMRLEEKAGMRKAKLNEGKKSPALMKLDSAIDQQFKLYEGVISKKKGKVNEMFGLGIAEKFAKLDPNDEMGVNNLFQVAYKNILINPHMSRIGQVAKRLTTPEKYALVQQYVQGGGGSLRLDKTGKVVYVTKEYQDKGIGTPKGGGSTGLPGL